MGQRSYLYPGRDTEALSPQERMLERLYDQLDRPGNRLTPAQFFSSPEAAQLLDQIHGSLTDRLPPGSQIVSQTPGKITYRDAEGYEHNIIRKPDGQFSETTNRPAIVPTQTQKGQQDFAQQLQAMLSQGFSQPATFAELPPEVRAQLQAISDAEVASNTQQLNDLQGQLIARLYGNNVNQSSIANEAGARFAQQAGLVQQQQKSDAANRLLATIQYLTNLGQQKQALGSDLYANITGQQNQRDIASAGLDVDLKKIVEAGRQFDASNYLETLRTQIQQEQLDQSRSPLNKILKISEIAANLAGAAGGGLSAYNALTGGRNKGLPQSSLPQIYG